MEGLLYSRRGIVWREGVDGWYVKFNQVWLPEYEAPIAAFKSGNIVTVRVFDEPMGQPEGDLMAEWVIGPSKDDSGMVEKTEQVA